MDKEDKLIGALRDVLKHGGDEEKALTCYDLQKQLKLSENHVRKRLRQLKDEGRLRVVHVRRPSIDGRMNKIPAYILTEGNTDGEA